MHRASNYSYSPCVPSLVRILIARIPIDSIFLSSNSSRTPCTEILLNVLFTVVNRYKTSNSSSNKLYANNKQNLFRHSHKGVL